MTFRVGDMIEGTDYDCLPVGAEVAGEWTRTGPDANDWTASDGHRWAARSGPRAPRPLTHLPDATQPEPLKGGDWVQIWAKVHDPSPKDGELVALRVRIRGGGMAIAYTTDDAIIRPDAGQMPPWVKPARCTSLKRTMGNRYAVWQCTHNAPHNDMHKCGDAAWTTADESGRITERGAS